MTSDMGEMFNTAKAGKRALRSHFGRPCPRCPEKRPKAHPSILQPGQRCKVDGFLDPRPRPSVAERNECYRAAGVDMVEIEPRAEPWRDDGSWIVDDR